ncbi:hypothetical protein R4Q14_06075 [Brachyspira intermedia]|uniref:hypothetical protein n=1 Tax=Brachyspira intermedia TaxID=84377 RepID=UPI00300559A7
MKKFYLLILMTSIFMISCGGHFFNPRYYFNNRYSSSANNGGGESEDIGGGGENLDPEDDPFYNNGERPWNDPDYKFKMNFDEMVIRAEFDDKNRPTYKLVPGAWYEGDSSRNEYKNDGPGTSAAGNSVSSVVYYLYKGKNPTFSSNSSYNQSDRLERFYFYRFTGSALGVVNLDNFLIAIDTYSKLVFAFAVPSYWEKPVSIVNSYAPTKWGAVENGWEAKYAENTQDRFDNVDGIQYFYEYDPVGVLHSDGTIEVFQWCLDSIGDNNKYAPRVKGNAIDLTRPIASETEKEGRSPYMPIAVEETTRDTITITAKSFKNISARSAEGYLSWTLKPQYDDIQEYAYFTYTISASAYDSEVSSGDLIDIEHLDPRDDSLTGMIYVNEVKKIDKNSDISFGSSKSFEIKNMNENAYIDLSSRIFKYNTLTVLGITCIDTDNFGEGGSGVIAEKTSPMLKLKYDPSKDAFVIDSSSSITQNTSTSASITAYPDNFTLERGVPKDITIRYKWMKGNDPNGEEVEVTYTLEFQSAE